MSQLGVPGRPGAAGQVVGCSREVRSAGRRRLALGGCGLALGVTNLVAAPRLGRPASLVWNLATSVVLLRVARWAGVDRAAIGLQPQRRTRGLAVGAAGSGMVLALMVGSAATRTGRELLDDERVTQARWAQTWLHVGVFIPLGTVVLEEVAFRGVLPALLDPSGRSGVRGVAVPALLFGAWHIVSGQDFVAAHRDDPAAAERATGSVPGIVVATSAAGLVLGLVRRWGGHLISPALLHTTANATATVLGRLLSDPALRRRWSRCRGH